MKGAQCSSGQFLGKNNNGERRVSSCMETPACLLQLFASLLNFKSIVVPIGFLSLSRKGSCVP